MLIGRSPSRDMFRGYFGESDTKISIGEHSHSMVMSDVDGCIEPSQPCRYFTYWLPGYVSGCQIPARLLCGNWTQDKGNFPQNLLNVGVRVDPSNEILIAPASGGSRMLYVRVLSVL